ncbi:MAG: RrF2 family transcriptional regulator [Myxococcaceae bacterium]
MQISRKIEYGLRATLFLASVPEGQVVPFREIARRMGVPQDFLAKILKRLVQTKVVRSTRGARGGYCLARGAAEVSFLDVIEAVEGPLSVNLCTTEEPRGCSFSMSCTMLKVWKLGQDRMLEVYRAATLDKLAMRDLRAIALPGLPA